MTRFVVIALVFGTLATVVIVALAVKLVRHWRRDRDDPWRRY